MRELCDKLLSGLRGLCGVLFLLFIYPFTVTATAAQSPSAVELSSSALQLSAAGPEVIHGGEQSGTYRFYYDLRGEGSMESGVSLVWNSSLLLYRGLYSLAGTTGLHARWYSRPFFLPILTLAFPAPRQFLHEYYGHGSVLREFGFTDITYRWSWFNISSENGKAVSQRIQTQGTYEENQLWLGGGEAASQLYLLEAEKEMYRNGRGALLMFLPVQASMNDLSNLKEGLNADDLLAGNDGASWLRDFKNQHGGSQSLTVKFAGRSGKAVSTAGLDPVIPWLAFTCLHYLWTGEDSYYAPMLPLGGLKFGFSPKADLTPLGPENYYYIFIAGKGKLASLYYRTGSSPEGEITGYGAEFGPLSIHGLALTPGFDSWRLPTAKTVGLKFSGNGFNIRLKADVPLYNTLGLTGKAAYKTDGYLLGMPAPSGFYGYGGVSMTF